MFYAAFTIAAVEMQVQQKLFCALFYSLVNKLIVVSTYHIFQGMGVRKFSNTKVNQGHWISR